MTSPFIGIFFIGIAVYGMILLWQGETGHDIDLFGASPGTKGLFGLGGTATRPQSIGPIHQRRIRRC